MTATAQTTALRVQAAIWHQRLRLGDAEVIDTVTGYLPLAIAGEGVERLTLVSELGGAVIGPLNSADVSRQSGSRAGVLVGRPRRQAGTGTVAGAGAVGPVGVKRVTVR